MSSCMATSLPNLQRAGCRIPGRSAQRAPRSTIVRAVRNVEDAKHGVLSAAAATALAVLPLVTAAAPARAEEEAVAAAAAGPSSVDTAVDGLVSGIKTAGEVVKQGIEFSGVAAEKAKGAYDTVAPYVKQAADAAAPVVAEGAQQVSKAVQSLEPQVKDVLKTSAKQTVDVLKTSGVDPSYLESTSKTVDGVVATSKPLLQQVFQFLTTTPPEVLGEYALGGVAVYYLGPSVLGWLLSASRRYAGDLSAAAALDQVCSESNTYLVDVRTRKEKEAAGVPDLPYRDRLLEVDYAIIEDRKLRGALRNPAGLEALLTALQVANLKKLNKNSTVLLMDKNGGSAKAIAKEMASRGFRNSFVISGGFEGRGGWSQSKLPSKGASTYSNAEVLAPIAALPVGGGMRTPSPAPVRRLPSPAPTRVKTVKSPRPPKRLTSSN